MSFPYGLRPYQYVKGQSGSPGGKSKKWLSSEIVKDKIDECVDKTMAELDMILENKESKAIDLIFASVIKKVIEDGDVHRLEGLLSRSVGKVRNVLDATVSTDSALRLSLKQKTNQELIEMMEYTRRDDNITGIIQVGSSGGEHNK